MRCDYLLLLVVNAGFIYTEEDSRTGSGLRQSPGVELLQGGTVLEIQSPLAAAQPQKLSRSPEPILESSSVYAEDPEQSTPSYAEYVL